MDWRNELYVKLYRRETTDDLMLSWEARALWHEMLKRFDRSGIITGRRGALGLAALVRIPQEVVQRAMLELLEDGRIAATEDGWVAPNFMTAQDSRKSDKLRQAEARDRRRNDAMSQSHAVTKRDVSSQNVTTGGVTESDVSSQNVTARDAHVTARDAVTNCDDSKHGESFTSHTASHGVTRSHSEKRREEKSSARSRGSFSSHAVTKSDAEEFGRRRSKSDPSVFHVLDEDGNSIRLVRVDPDGGESEVSAPSEQRGLR
jgi:hypothetical protein